METLHWYPWGERYGAPMNRPLAWAALSLAAGLYAAAMGWFPGGAGPLVLLAIPFSFFFAGRGFPHRDRVIVVSVFLTAGVVLWHASRPAGTGDPLSRHSLAHPGTPYDLEGSVRETALFYDKPGPGYFILDAENVSVAGTATGLRGRVLVRWLKPTFPVYVGERVRIAGVLNQALGPVNYGIRAFEDYQRVRGVYSEARANSVEKLGGGWQRPRYWVARLRVWEARALERSVPPRALPFVLTVWLGARVGGFGSEGARSDEGGRPPAKNYDAYTRYIDSGTAHILAVSGVHVSIVYVSVTVLLRLFLRRRRLRALLTMAAVALFAASAGARLSCLRAAFMLILYLSADLFDREPDPPTALSLSGMFFLVLNPDGLFDVGLLLSFASVASILLYAERFGSLFGCMPWWLRQGLGTSLGVQVLPLPLAIHFFHILPVLGPVANLAVVPLLTVVLWLTLLTVVCAAILPPAALLFGHAIAPVFSLIDWIAGQVTALSWAHPTVVSPTKPAALCYWAGMAALAVAISKIHTRELPVFASGSPGGRGRSRYWVAAAALVLLLAGALWRPWRPPATVDFLDVGHADAAFVRTPGGSTLLIDGGGLANYKDAGARIVVPFLLTHGVDSLDYVIASHSDSDHMDGLIEVVRRLSVGAAILGPIETDQAVEHEFLAACSRYEVPVARLARGDRLPVKGAQLEILHPPAGMNGGSINDLSLVVRLAWPGLSLLFTGDIEKEAEHMVFQGDCQAIILKAPHHGSPTSSSPSLLDAVAPAHVVVSTRPSWYRRGVEPGVLERYTSRGIHVWRTDWHGGIRIREVDGRWVLRAARLDRGYSLETSPSP